MSICPKDGKPCCDDMCHGSGCIRMGGYAILERCDTCGGVIDEEIPDCGTCRCDYDDDDWDPDYYYWDEDCENYYPDPNLAKPDKNK